MSLRPTRCLARTLFGPHKREKMLTSLTKALRLSEPAFMTMSARGADEFLDSIITIYTTLRDNDYVMLQ